MTTVNTQTTPTGNPGNLPTPPAFTKIGHILRERVALHMPRAARSNATASTPGADIARQQAIENALSMALYLVRTSDTAEALQRATGRAIRAASMLKQACADMNSGVTA